MKNIFSPFFIFLVQLGGEKRKYWKPDSFLFNVLVKKGSEIAWPYEFFISSSQYLACSLPPCRARGGHNQTPLRKLPSETISELGGSKFDSAITQLSEHGAAVGSVTKKI